MAIRKDTIQLSIEINGIKAGQTTKQIRNEVRDLKRELDNLDPASQGFIDKMKEIQKRENFLATVRKGTHGATQDIKGLTARMFPLIDAFKTGGVAAAGFFALDLARRWGSELISWVTKGTAALESMERKSALVLGDSIGLVEDFAAINAQSLGITEEKYVSLAATIADLLVPMGFQREEAGKLSGETVNLVGALKEWDTQQRSAEEITKIVTKALTGEREGLKELGIVISEAEVQSRLLAEGQNKLTGQALQQAKAQITLNLITEKSLDAQRAFAANQDTIVRSGARMKAFFATIGESILRGLIEPAKALGSLVADTFAPFQRQSELVLKQQTQYNILIDTLKRGGLERENEIKLIDRVNALHKDYTDKIITEKTTLAELVAIQTEVNGKFREQINILAVREKIDDVIATGAELVEQQLDIQLAITETQKKIDAFSGIPFEDLSESAQNSLARMALDLQSLQIDLENTGKKIDETEVKKNKLLQAGRDLGINVDAILNPVDPGVALSEAEAKRQAEAAAKLAEEERKKAEAAAEKARQDRLKKAEDAINLEHQLQLRALREAELSEEEFNHRVEVLNLESENKKKLARIKILKLTQAEILQLQNEIADNELKVLAEQAEFKLESTLRIIEREKLERLRIIREAYDDEIEAGEAAALVVLNAERKVLEARLDAAEENSLEYLSIEQDLAEKIEQIQKKLLDQNEREHIASINRRRNDALDVLDQMGLDEQDLATSRVQINLAADIEILESQLANYAQGAEERLRIERELVAKRKQLASSTFQVTGGSAADGPSSSPEDKETSDLGKQIEQAALDTSRNLASAQLEISRNRIEEELRLELEAIDAIERRKLEAAGDDAELQKKIRAQAAKDRANAERAAAIERKKTARKEAVIQGALAVIEALPNVAASIAAGIATALQLAVIDSQTFFKGGDTGKKAIYRDRQGHGVAGVVHVDEYVVPKVVKEDPAAGPAINYLERIRRTKGGFQDGGFTTVSTQPTFTAQTLTSNASSNEMGKVISLLEGIYGAVRSFPTKLRAEVAYTDIEKVKGEVDYIRELADVA